MINISLFISDIFAKSDIACVIHDVICEINDVLYVK